MNAFDEMMEDARRRLLADLWRRTCGLPELGWQRPTIDDLYRTEWSPEFEGYMRNRLVMGALRYGRLNEPGKPRYDRVAAIINRVRDYERTGNLEPLVDVANLALLEFVEGRHPLRHFSPSDDGEHVRSTRGEAL